VADDYRLLSRQSVDETHDVTDIIENRIFLYVFRTFASPVAAQIGSDRVKSGLCQRRELMAP